MDYSGKRWAQKRAHILKRDKYLDQVLLRRGVRVEAKLVHHILPAEDWPEYQWCDWNLISINDATHRQLHEPYTKALTPLGQELADEVAEEHGIRLTTVTLVIGLPGSGKSTWIKNHLGSGICYELDAIASAFRLTVPHAEKEHAGARRMAAALRRSWLAQAPKYSRKIFVNRAAPDLDEVAETDPDVLVVCTHIWKSVDYEFDEAEAKQRINEAIEWAELNGIPLVYYPEEKQQPKG